jgi:alanine racemase
MDLAIFDMTDAPPIADGDWLEVPFDLPAIAAATARTPYELLTGLGHRYARRYR